jgi:hypothetical protein
MRIEYYTDLFKFGTYKMFLGSIAMLLGILIYPTLRGYYQKGKLFYYKKNK